MSANVSYIKPHEPTALRRLTLKLNHLTHKVQGVANTYWWIIGTAEKMMQIASAVKQP